MFVRRASWSQLCLGVKIGRNVQTAPFNGRKCSYRPLPRAKCSYRPKLDCSRLTTHSHATRLFPPIWTQNVVCTSSNMVAMWLVWPCRPWYTIYYYYPLIENRVVSWNSFPKFKNHLRPSLTRYFFHIPYNLGTFHNSGSVPQFSFSKLQSKERKR